MSTLFTKIIEGDIPSYKIAESEYFCAFLDINPMVGGHVLVVSKKEEDYFFDLDDSTLASMIIFAKKVAKAMKQVIDCKKIGLMVIGLEIPHAHIHLIPISKESDIYSNNSKKQFIPEQFKIIAASVKSAFEI